MQLDLGFTRGPDGRTGLARRRVSYPWALARAFHLDAAPAGMATVMPQSSAGGLYPGDRLLQSVAVDTDAAAHVTTQGATVVHAGRDGRRAESDWRLDVAAGGWLEVINDPLVLFPDADLRMRIDIDARGVCVFADGFGGHPGAAFRRLASDLTIRRGGRVVARERVDISGADLAREQAAMRHGAAGVGVMLFLNVGSADLAAALRAAAGDDWVGIGELPNDAGLSARLVTPTLGGLPVLQRRLWVAFRLATTGHVPGDRRKGL